MGGVEGVRHIKTSQKTPDNDYTKQNVSVFTTKVNIPHIILPMTYLPSKLVTIAVSKIPHNRERHTARIRNIRATPKIWYKTVDDVAPQGGWCRVAAICTCVVQHHTQKTQPRYVTMLL